MGSARPIISTVKPSPSLQCANCWLFRPLADTNKNNTVGVFCKASWGVCYFTLSVTNLGDCKRGQKGKWLRTANSCLFAKLPWNAEYRLKSNILGAAVITERYLCRGKPTSGVLGHAALLRGKYGWDWSGLGPGWGNQLSSLPLLRGCLNYLLSSACNYHSSQHSVWREMVTRLLESTRLDIARHSWVLGCMMVGNVMGHNCTPVTAELVVLGTLSLG